MRTEDRREALASLAQAPDDSEPVRFLTLFVLARSGRLQWEMFHYPQQASSDALLLRDTAYDTSPLVTDWRSDLYLDLGRVNESQRWAHEALAVEGETPRVLERMALVYVLNGNPDAARTFVRALGRVPFQGARARQFQEALDRDPGMLSDPLVARIRPLMLRKDYVGDWSTEQVLQQCLDANPSNRMAFEYLLAHYLLTSDLKGFAELAPRLKDFYSALPTHVQEALLGYRNENGALPPGTDESAIDRGIDSRFRNFVQIFARYQNGPAEECWKALAPDFGTTWWFFYIFGRTAAGPPPQAPCRPIAKNGKSTMKSLCANGCRFAAALILPFVFVLSGCQSQWAEHPQRVSRHPVLYPDYAGTVIPPNIAPLNFVVKERGVRFLVRAEGEKGGAVEVSSRDGKIVWPAGAWKQLVTQNRGAAVSIAVTVEDLAGDCRKFDAVRIDIAREEVDRYVVYRLIPPVDHGYVNIGIYQRDLEGFSERPVIENQNFSVGSDGCMNCHSFRRNRPDRMSLQIRSRSLGRPMVVVKDGVPQTVDTSASGFSKSPAAYQDWHPNGRHIAYSVNKVMPLGHTTGEHRDVWDSDSDLAVYDTDANQVSTTHDIADPDRRETWPSWSADGKTLYFASAPQLPMTQLSDVRYNLMRIAYDAATGKWGRRETMVSSADGGPPERRPAEGIAGRPLAAVLAGTPRQLPDLPADVRFVRHRPEERDATVPLCREQPLERLVARLVEQREVDCPRQQARRGRPRTNLLQLLRPERSGSQAVCHAAERRVVLRVVYDDVQRSRTHRGADTGESGPTGPRHRDAGRPACPVARQEVSGAALPPVSADRPPRSSAAPR